jgi:hypothetical protein
MRIMEADVQRIGNPNGKRPVASEIFWQAAIDQQTKGDFDEVTFFIRDLGGECTPGGPSYFLILIEVLLLQAIRNGVDIEGQRS